MPATTDGRRTGTGRRTRRAVRACAAGTAAALLIPLCAAAPGPAAEAPPPRTLQEAFTVAAERHGVPRSVLLAVSYLQSRWDGHGGAASVTGGYGPMHLTDTRAALRRAGADLRRGTGHGPVGDGGGPGAGDPRGDTRRPLTVRPRSSPSAGPARSGGRLPPRLRTLAAAARLTGLPPRRLRTDPAANIAGGAALLARAQSRLGLEPSADPADWYGAVARYSGAGDRATAAAFARDVFGVLRTGQRRITDSGQRVELAPRPGLRGERSQLRLLGLREPHGAGDRTECPPGAGCEWIPAPHERYRNDAGEEDYGNHDKAARTRSPRIGYVVIHDVEGYYGSATRLVQDPEYVSWHYTLRASDGHVAQHLRTGDVGWHAGNWYVNSRSVGLEHEGFLAAPDSWYTEAMYRASARLVRHLARSYGIPLDRQHILGHDNVPPPTAAAAPGMHTDPGPYWDWAHYFTLLGAPFEAARGTGADLVTVRPDYRRHRPRYTGCDGGTCPAVGSGAVRLRTAPRADAPLVEDPGLRPDGSPSTTGVGDTGARASTGQQFAVAGRRDGWTAVWYLGRRAWFRDPRGARTAVPAKGAVVTPAPGRDRVRVYGSALPEAAAYPAQVPVQRPGPLPYRMRSGQRYALGPRTAGEYLWAESYDPRGEKSVLVRGERRYHQVQFGHRIAFVRAEDVRVVRPGG